MDLIFSGCSLNLADSQHSIYNSWNVLVAIRRWFVVVGKWLARRGRCVPLCSPVPIVVIWLPAGRRYTGWIYTSFKAGACLTVAVHWLSLMFVFTFCFTKNSEEVLFRTFTVILCITYLMLPISICACLCASSGWPWSRRSSVGVGLSCSHTWTDWPPTR